MLLTTRFSFRVLLMSVGQIVERGLAELVEAAGHRARVACTSNARVRRHQSQREPPDGHLRCERPAVHDADGSLPAALGEADGHSRRLAACHGSYQYPRRAWCGWELRRRV